MCGGLIEQQLNNPVGGVQPYTFQKETLLEIHGDIPFGLTLHPNGVLEGTPIKQDAGKTFKFKVCAIDNTRSFVCEETSLRVVEEVELGQIGGSLKYRVTYQANIKYTLGKSLTGTIKHEISSDVTLTEVKPGLFIQWPELASWDEGYFFAPKKTAMTASWLPKEDNCVGPPVSLTYEGQARITMVYYENLDLLEVINIDWNSPDRERGEECSTEDLIWESSLREGPGQLSPKGLKTGLRQEKLSEEKTRQLVEYLSVLLGQPQKLPEKDEAKGLFFDINGGTITGEFAIDSVVFQSATLTVTLISAEKAAEEPSPPLVEEEPSGPPTTLSGDVKSWTVEGGEEGTICNPVAHPDSPCKELSGPVQQGDIIKTGADNYGKIPLHNGRSTILLGPNTILKVFKISEDEAIFVFFNLPYKVRALLDAPQGVKTLFAISGCSYVKPDPGSIETLPDPLKIIEFEERCSVSPAEFYFLATGTEFTFEQQSDKTTRLTVLEGEVQVWKPADQGVIVTVGTNQQLVLEVDAPLVPSSIDPASIDRWWIEAEAAQPQQITPPSGGGCLIATAAFGSELTPQVQFLRNFRDERILSTAAGSSFMNVFNMWYYSFSPSVANAEREIPVLQQTIKYAIYPLLGILTIAEKAYSIFNGEVGAVTAGFVTSSMIGFVYFWPIAYAIAKVRRRFSSNVLIYPVLVSLVGVIAGILISDPILLMITTSAFVVTVVGVSAVLSSKLTSKIIRK